MTKSQIPTKPQIQNPNPDGARKPYDLRERTFEFALRVLRITARLPGTPEAIEVRSQLCGAATSIGANIEEGDGSISKADKRKSFVVARKEAREARYWLRIVERVWPEIAGAREEVAEATEILNILSVIIEKLS